MRISCTICTNLFDSTSDVFRTDCGHLFHYACLIQWIERSKTCPQCRKNTTERLFRRVYFNAAMPVEDASFSQSSVDNMKLQIHQKDAHITKMLKDISKLNNENKHLRETVKNVEEHLNSLESNIYAYKMKLGYLEGEKVGVEASVEEAEVTMGEVKTLREHAAMLKRIQKLVKGSVEETEEIVDSHGDKFESMKSLSTCYGVLRRELLSTEEKNKIGRDRLKHYARDVRICADEIERQEAKVKKLEVDLQYSEQTKISLEEKVSDIKRILQLSKNKSLRDNYLIYVLEMHLVEGDKIPEMSELTEENIKDLMGTYSPEKNSKPMIPCMRNGLIVLAPANLVQRFNPKDAKYSVFNPRQRNAYYELEREETHEVYDGLGGHCKPDAFPIPQHRASASRKPRIRQDSFIRCRTEKS